MWVSKLRAVAVSVLAVGVLGLGAGTVSHRTLAGEPTGGQAEGPGRPAAKGQAPAADSPTVADLTKARLQAAREVYQLLRRQYRAGQASAADIAQWSPHLLEAELDAAATPAEREAALKAHVERMAEGEKFAKASFDAGRLSATEFGKVRCLYLEAQLRLAKDKAPAH